MQKTDNPLAETVSLPINYSLKSFSDIMNTRNADILLSVLSMNSAVQL